MIHSSYSIIPDDNDDDVRHYSKHPVNNDRNSYHEFDSLVWMVYNDRMKDLRRLDVMVLE